MVVPVKCKDTSDGILMVNGKDGNAYTVKTIVTVSNVIHSTDIYKDPKLQKQLNLVPL